MKIWMVEVKLATGEKIVSARTVNAPELIKAICE
jgi:hypothetical protein